MMLTFKLRHQGALVLLSVVTPEELTLLHGEYINILSFNSIGRIERITGIPQELGLQVDELGRIVYDD